MAERIAVMSKPPRNPSHPPTLEPEEARDSRAQEAVAPGASLYLRALGSDTRKKLVEAHKIKDLDWEIALLRVRLRKLLVLEQTPDEDEGKECKEGEERNKGKAVKSKYETRILKLLELLIRAYSARTRALKDSPDADDDAIGNMIKDAAENFGLTILPWDSNC